MSRPRRAVLLLLVYLLSACTAWHTQRVTPEVLLQQSQPYRIRVRRTDGSRVVLVDPAIRGDSVVGRWHRYDPLPGPTRPGMPTSTRVEVPAGVPLAEVREVQTHGLSVGRTALLVTGVGLVIYVAVVAAEVSVLDAAHP